MPSRKNEAWRFADLGWLDFTSYGQAPSLTPEQTKALVEQSVGIEKTVGRIVFVNDAVVHVDESLSSLGIRLQRLAEADAATQELLAQGSTELGSDKLLALHQANLAEAAVIVIPAGVQLESPLEIFHWASGDGSSVFPHTLVVAEKGARASVLEHHLSAEGETHFSCGVTQLCAHEAGKLSYVLSQRRSAQSKSLQMTSVHAAKDAQVIHCQLNLGAGWSRHECVSHLDGSGSRSDMLGVALTDGTMEADNRTLQLHHAPHAQSDLLYKNVLFGKSRNIFAGLIVVDKEAHFTDAYQTCRNLLMSDECEANAMPGLEINADQVKCSHGSTSGAISPEEIFYLKSRGVTAYQAKALLAEGFLSQTLERIPDEGLREFLLAQVATRFAQALASE